MAGSRRGAGQTAHYASGVFWLGQLKGGSLRRNPVERATPLMGGTHKMSATVSKNNCGSGRLAMASLTLRRGGGVTKALA